MRIPFLTSVAPYQSLASPYIRVPYRDPTYRTILARRLYLLPVLTRINRLDQGMCSAEIARGSTTTRTRFYYSNIQKSNFKKPQLK